MDYDCGDVLRDGINIKIAIIFLNKSSFILPKWNASLLMLNLVDWYNKTFDFSVTNSIRFHYYHRYVYGGRW